MAQAKYDFTWLQDGIDKRWANYSNIICFETADPFRLTQLMAFLRDKMKDTDIYLLNKWLGLCRLNKEDGESEKVLRGATGGYDQEVQNTIESIRDALKYMDDTLKNRKSILVVNDIDAHNNQFLDEVVIFAFREWAHNSEVTLRCNRLDLI